MTAFICETCGVQYPPSEIPPAHCLICQEERQYVNPKGQTWTTMKHMQTKAYYNRTTLDEPGLISLHTVPSFGIAQTAYLVQTPTFNILWDCITYLDDKTIQTIKDLGGIDAIALSHPHYYSAQVEWAEAFDAPIYIHEDDREWVVRPSERIIFWSGEKKEISLGLTLHRLGGHFKGGAVLHWADGNEAKGVLLTGDIIQVVADEAWVSFMYSYPNLIPLPAATVQRMAHTIRTLPYARLYNAFHRIVREEASEAVQRSADRYIKALSGQLYRT